MRPAALLALAFAAAATAASGQEADPAARWASINSAFPAPAASVVKDAVAAAETDCPSATLTLGPIEPATAWPRIDQAIRDGEAVNAWSVTVSRPDCPAEQTYARYVIVQGIGGSLTAQLLHPGRSYVDLYNLTEGAMPKAMRTAANTAARDVPGCSPGWINASGRLLRTEIVDDSKVGANSYGLRSGSWREAWVFRICDRQLSVFVDFAGGPDGVTATPSSWASLKR